MKDEARGSPGEQVPTPTFSSVAAAALGQVQQAIIWLPIDMAKRGLSRLSGTLSGVRGLTCIISVVYTVWVEHTFRCTPISHPRPDSTWLHQLAPSKELVSGEGDELPGSRQTPEGRVPFQSLGSFWGEEASLLSTAARENHKQT